ncbi:hypothetical protein [Alloalcanivorax gelatiniphagus]|uniref:Hyalin n=1 Tax=Alloalcanivorax gelatiniphagus TaxID=1194167 RepID=A0ABY2XPM7_9GAMM|nr:hypothetical protein FGS76_02080 [Alloalcanivorax gelatiniphagus]
MAMLLIGASRWNKKEDHMKKAYCFAIPFVRYAALCLPLALLAACGGNDHNATGGAPPDTDRPVTHAYRELLNLTSYDVGLYRFDVDGSAELVKDMDHTGVVDAVMLGELNGITYFSASTDTEGRELWRTDGTRDGTYIVQDLAPGTASGLPGGGGIVYNRALYFSAVSPAYPGTGLWKLEDGQDSPEFVTNTRSASTDDADPSEFLAYDGQLLFYALKDDGAGGTDHKILIGTGKAENHELIDPAVASQDGFNTDSALLFQGDLYFQASAGSYGSGGLGNVLYKSDGTPEGTQVLADINETGDLDSDARIGKMVSIGSDFVFPANDAADDNSNSSHDNMEIWASDGTPAGTRMIKNLHPGSTTISSLVSNGVTAYFVARPEGSGTCEIWRTQGTAESTQMIGVYTDSADLYAHGDRVLAVTRASGEEYLVSLINGATHELTALRSFPGVVDYAFSLGARDFVLADSDPDGWKELWVYNGDDQTFTQVKVADDAAIGVNAH